MRFGGGQTAIALAVAFGILPFEAVAQQQPSATNAPPSVDVQAIMNFCSGQTRLTVPGNSRGSGSDKDGYTFQFNSSKDVEVTRGGILMYRVEKPTLEGMSDCVAKIYKTLSQPPIPEQKQCRIPANGVEKYKVNQDFSGNSDEMSGGHSQPEWCSKFTATLRAGHGEGTYTTVASSESTRSGCSPFNCTLYTYHCTVHVQADPIYNLKSSPDCP